MKYKAVIPLLITSCLLAGCSMRDIQEHEVTEQVMTPQFPTLKDSHKYYNGVFNIGFNMGRNWSVSDNDEVEARNEQEVLFISSNNSNNAHIAFIQEQVTDPTLLGEIIDNEEALLKEELSESGINIVEVTRAEQDILHNSYYHLVFDCDNSTLTVTFDIKADQVLKIYRYFPESVPLSEALEGLYKKPSFKWDNDEFGVTFQAPDGWKQEEGESALDACTKDYVTRVSVTIKDTEEELQPLTHEGDVESNYYMIGDLEFKGIQYSRTHDDETYYEYLTQAYKNGKVMTIKIISLEQYDCLKAIYYFTELGGD